MKIPHAITSPTPYQDTTPHHSTDFSNHPHLLILSLHDIQVFEYSRYGRQMKHVKHVEVLHDSFACHSLILVNFRPSSTHLRLSIIHLLLYTHIHTHHHLHTMPKYNQAVSTQAKQAKQAKRQTRNRAQRNTSLSFPFHPPLSSIKSLNIMYIILL